MKNLGARYSPKRCSSRGLVTGLVTNPVTASMAGAATSGATATYAEAPGAAPNYILPLLTGAYYSVANIEQFQRLSYRSLYWIGDKGKPVGQPTVKPGQNSDIFGQQHRRQHNPGQVELVRRHTRDFSRRGVLDQPP